MKMITILLLGLIAGILLIGSGCCEREIDDTQDITTQEKSKDSKEVREIVERTYTTDTYDNKDGTFTQTSYMGAVNIWWWDKFIPVEDYLNPVVDGDSLVFNDPNGNKIIEFRMNYEKENALSISSPKIEVTKRRGGYYFETDADAEVKSMEYELSSDIADLEFEDDKLMINKIEIDFGMAKEEQNITTTFDKNNSKLIFEIEEGKTGSLKVIDPIVSYDYDTETNIWAFTATVVDDTPPPANTNPPSLKGSFTEVTSDSDLDSDDGNYIIVDIAIQIAGGDEGWHLFNASIQESNINNISWYWNGKTEDSSDVTIYFYLWDYGDSSWDASDCDSSTTSTSDVDKNCITSDSKYISDDGMTTFLVYGHNSDPSNARMMYTDFIKLEVDYTAGSPALNLTYPRTDNSKSVSPNATMTVWFNVTDSSGDLVTSGVTPFNITIGGTEAYLHNYSLVGDIFKFRSDDDSSSDAGGTGTFSFGSLDNTSYASLITPKSDGDTPFSCAFVTKGLNSVSYKIEDDEGNNEEANLFNLVIPYGDYELNSTTHMECEKTGSGSQFTPTFNTAFPDTNYAIFCNPADDTDSPLCISYNDGTYKKTTTMGLYIQDDGDAEETVSSIDWCAISYGVWNFTMKAGDDIVVQVGQSDLLSAGNNRTADLYENMPSTDYVVITTHEDNDAVDPSVCKVTSLNLGNFDYDCEDDGGAGGGADEYFYWIAISLDGDANTTKVSIEDDFGLADDGHNWTANVTVPTGCSGASDLMVNVSYDGDYISSLESNAITCAAGDTCTCPGDSSAHEFDCSDECDVATCTAGDVTFINTGFVRCGGAWSIGDLGDPGSGCTLWIDNDCDMEIS